MYVIIINVIDASNLQRSLYLTFQLLDLKRPMIIVLNMMDVAKMEGYEIYTALLQEKLHCLIVAVSASRKEGILELKKVISAYDSNLYLNHLPYNTLNPKITGIIDHELRALANHSPLNQMTQWELLETIKNDANDLQITDFSAADKASLQTMRNKISAFSEEEFDIALASSQLTHKIDKWALGRITGIPLFFTRDAPHVCYLHQYWFGIY